MALGTRLKQYMKSLGKNTRPRSSSSPGPLGHARSPQSLGHTEPEVQENLQQFLKRMLLNWDALAPVTMFKVNYEKTKYFSVDILTG